MWNSAETVQARLRAVMERIATAARAAGRDPASVSLVAVSKTFPADAVAAVHAAGQAAFGENYVQEAVDKIETLRPQRGELEWHFIGPIQSNKTRAIAEQFDWVQSIDRLKVAQRLSEQRPPDLAAVERAAAGEHQRRRDRRAASRRPTWRRWRGPSAGCRG